MELLPIQPELENNQAFAANPLCAESLSMTLDFYKRAGFQPPWISYYAQQDGELVGMVRITARTIENDSYSARLLRKNGFDLLGTV